MGFNKQYNTEKDDDCLRKAIAYYLDIHASKVKYIQPNSNMEPSFWKQWDAYLEGRFSKQIRFWNGDYENKWGKHINELMANKNLYWIASVRSLYDKKQSHAVVMKGPKLVYDPAIRLVRSRKPTKFNYGLTLENI